MLLQAEEIAHYIQSRCSKRILLCNVVPEQKDILYQVTTQKISVCCVIIQRQILLIATHTYASMKLKHLGNMLSGKSVVKCMSLSYEIANFVHP